MGDNGITKSIFKIKGRLLFTKDFYQRSGLALMIIYRLPFFTVQLWTPPTVAVVLKSQIYVIVKQTLAFLSYIIMPWSRYEGSLLCDNQINWPIPLSQENKPCCPVIMRWLFCDLKITERKKIVTNMVALSSLT